MTLTKSSAAALAALALAAAARPAAAQRELYGISSSGAAEMRKQFTTDAREQVSATLVDYTSAWGSRDLRGLMRFYAPNAVLYPLDGGMQTGRDAIREYFRRRLAQVGPMEQRIVEFRASGDLAYVTTQVKYAVSDGGASSDVVATEVLALHRDSLGNWSIVSHLARQEQATPSASAPSTGVHASDGH